MKALVITTDKSSVFADQRSGEPLWMVDGFVDMPPIDADLAIRRSRSKHRWSAHQASAFLLFTVKQHGLVGTACNNCSRETAGDQKG